MQPNKCSSVNCFILLGLSLCSGTSHKLVYYYVIFAIYNDNNDISQIKKKKVLYFSGYIYVSLISSVNFSMAKILMKKYGHSFKASLVRKELYLAILYRILTLIG